MLAPLHLYAAAVYSDTTLKEHQQIHLAEYFGREIIPQFWKTAQQEGLRQDGPSTNSKTRVKDTEKLIDVTSPSQNSTRAPRTLRDVQAEVSKFTKKQKISVPDEEQIAQVKRDALKQNGASIRAMTRGSDILQNLIWILLAQASEGLYRSSGKDTSRMIDQYKLVGDEGAWKRLVRWRDRLKSQQAGEVDVREMKVLAVKVLEDMGINMGGP